jgi:PAS domain S-box-containing protein
MEERLKESEEKYRLITTSTNDGIITLDSNGIITYVNPSGQEMLRKDAEQIIGRHFTDFIADEYKEKVVKEFYRGLAGESIALFEIEAVDDSGKRLQVELSGSAMGTSEDKAAIVAVRDVSERWKARIELKKAHDALECRVEERTAELVKAKEQAELYLNLMGHDINNMNQVAMGYLEIAASLLKRDPASAFIERSLAVLSESSRLIDNLRKVQQATGKKLKLERIDLDAILSQVRSEYSLVPGREVTICYRPVKGYVMANPLLKDVFLNIVGNAIKHSTGPVHVAIRASPVKGHGKRCHEVTIEDDGPGILDGQKEKIFSRPDRTANAMGRGLGLYIVKSLVDGFGGSIRVEDRIPGDHSKGCRFVVLLPAVD